MFNGESTYLQEVVDHPNYDSFWQSRSLPKNMKNVKCAVLNVGGWFDAEILLVRYNLQRCQEEQSRNSE